MAGQRKGRGRRAWVGDASVGDGSVGGRMDWAFKEARDCVESQPWAAVVLVRVAVEVGVAGVVDVLTEMQEPAMQRWIEGLRVDTLSRDEETDMLDALLAPTGKTIKGDGGVWHDFREHVHRRHAFIHRAEQPTVEQARESIAACEAFFDRLMTITEEHLDHHTAAQQRRVEELRTAARREALEELAED
jgi:hypothetical protein